MTLNPELQILTLQHNKISQIGSASFQFHPELLQVDLSHNGLETVQVADLEQDKESSFKFRLFDWIKVNVKRKSFERTQKRESFLSEPKML